MNRRNLSALILYQDQNWDRSRQIPLEPTRWGKIVVLNSSILEKYPLIKTYLKKRKFQGSYFATDTLKHSIDEKKYVLTQNDNELIKLARKFARNKDLPTAYLLRSLLFEAEYYKVIEDQVHFRLSSSMLGPNPIVAKPIVDSIIKYIHKYSPKNLVILDPFAGNGTLGLIIAETLLEQGITDFIVLNNDLSVNVHEHAARVLIKLVPDRFKKVEGHLKFIKGDGLKLNHIPDHSVHLIVSLRALHEHSSSSVEQFFRICSRKLALKGGVIIDDVTRERTILKRAKKLLPFLGQMTAFRLITEGKIKLDNSEQLVDKIVNGDPYLTQAGVQSYVSGFRITEFINLAKLAGFKPSQIDGYYNYDIPFPIGSMQFRLQS